MEIAYLHVVLNHLPIFGIPFALGVLLLGLSTGSGAVQRTALLAFVVIGLLTIPVYLAGEGGEDFIEHLPGVSEEAIHEHEEMAEIALYAVLALTLFSLYVFLRHGGVQFLRRVAPDAPLPRWASAAALLAGLVAAGCLGYAGKLGGKIRHTEFYTGPCVGEACAQVEHQDDDGGKQRRRGRDH